MSDQAIPVPVSGVPEESVDQVTRVPLMDPRRVYDVWGPQAERDVVEILRSHAYVKGAHVAGFEADFAEYVGVRHAVAVDSCTDALTLILRAVLRDRAPERRDVILPTFTFVATAGAVVNAGGRPVFADVDEDTHNLDPASLAALCTDATAAVVPVHLFGAPVDLDACRAAVGREDLFVLEDAAQAIHATWNGRRCGGLADAAAFSFYPSKNLGAAGDGGIVTTDAEDLAMAVAALRDHGQTRKLYDHARVGTNSRMDEIQAAVLQAKLPHIGDWTAERRAVASRYDQAFQGTTCRPQQVAAEAESAYHLYTVRLPDRDRVRAHLTERGIATGIYYPLPLHQQSCFGGYAPDACPVAERLAQEVLSLPCFPGMRRVEQDAVIAAVQDVLAR